MAAGKRYQVFVSSTYLDLKAERQAVSAALLNVNAFPAGMELFPAGNEGAWELVTRVIDASDYYLLVIGGKYGSVDEAGLSFTEREYDYAVASGKYVIPLLLDQNIDPPSSKTEPTPERREALEKFRAKVEKVHVVRYWENADQLALEAIYSLNAAVEVKPQIGWIRADQTTPVEALAEIRELREVNESLRAEMDKLLARSEGPESAAGLAAGDELFEVEVAVYRVSPNQFALPQASGSGSVEMSWDEMFRAVATGLYGPDGERGINRRLSLYIDSMAADRVHVFLGGNSPVLWSNLDSDRFELSVEQPPMDRILAQFQQLGYLVRSVRQGTVLWYLSDFGANKISRELSVRTGRASGDAGTGDG